MGTLLLFNFGCKIKVRFWCHSHGRRLTFIASSLATEMSVVYGTGDERVTRDSPTYLPGLSYWRHGKSRSVAQSDAIKWNRRRRQFEYQLVTLQVRGRQLAQLMRQPDHCTDWSSAGGVEWSLVEKRAALDSNNYYKKNNNNDDDDDNNARAVHMTSFLRAPQVSAAQRRRDDHRVRYLGALIGHSQLEAKQQLVGSGVYIRACGNK